MVQTELRVAREVAIDNVAKGLLASLSKERRSREIVNELYLAEQRSEWAKESVKLASSKRDIVESLEMMVT